MKKERFHISISNTSSIDEYNTLGQYSTNALEFYENDKLRSKINIDIKKKKLIKENIDYKIEMEFNKEKETECSIYLKKEDKLLKLRVITLDFSFKDNNLYINYNIIDSNESVTYKVSIGG